LAFNGKKPFSDPFTSGLHKETVRSLDRLPVTIFLCGPGMKKKPAYGRKVIDIRSFVKSKLKNELKHCEVKIGEHREMIRAFAEAVGRRAANLADHEFALAKKKGIDLIIIFPCSPGSFAELGMFCLTESIAGKMRIFVNRRHRKKKSYLMEGPVKAAEQNNAKVFYIHYSRRNEIWHEIKDIVLEVKAKKRRRKLFAN